MAQNKLDYTGLTYDTIQAQITDLINSDTNFDKFRESSIAQTLIEVFTGTTDILNYYLNRRAEECYFDTAQLKSSVISLSRMLGYVMNRSEPARANLRMIVKGNIEDNQIQIPYYSKFSYSGDNYVLVNTLTYRFPNDQYILMNTDSEFTIDLDSFGNPIQIVQGEIKEKVFNGTTNAQVGAPFQIYKIEDTTFSNVYGDKDFFFNDVTQVHVGENKSDLNRFVIDRRSLLNWEYIYNAKDLNVSQKVCLIRTSTDGFVEILFGDGNDVVDVNTVENQQKSGGLARKGALTRKDNIYVQYLSTKGASANQTGVIRDKVNFSGKIYNSNGKDITSNITFQLLSNVYGGAQEESTDSIKYSAPKIYYSLDRLVAKDDYIAFLKSLTTPIVVQNALAWGEQEERNRYNVFALAKMFNVVLFTLTGSLYNLTANPHFAKSGDQYDDAVLDLDYDPYGFQTQGYFNVYILQKMVNQISRYTTLTTFYEIDGANFGEATVIEGETSSARTSRTLNDIAVNIQNQLKTNFPSGTATFGLQYASDIHECASNIKAPGLVTISGLLETSLTSQTGELYLNKLASKINDALQAFIDYRGNKIDNENFGDVAFIDRNDKVTLKKIIVWNNIGNLINPDDTANNDANGTNGTSFRFRLRFSEVANDKEVYPKSKCYITEFDNSLFLQILKLSTAAVFPVTVSDTGYEMNGKISSVLTEVSKRSQVSIKNIYVSPIIHRFNLVGTVYVKSLYDRMEVRRQITNALYEWLDINADFNTPIYLSNIMEIIENNLGVINANVRLQPEDITSGAIIKPSWTDRRDYTNTFYNPNPKENPIYRKYNYGNCPTCGDTLADIVNRALSGYLSRSSGTANIDTIRIMKDGINIYGSTLEKLSYTLANNLNERTFYLDFAGCLYKEFLDLAMQPLKQTCSIESYTCVGNDGAYIPNYSRFIGLSQESTIQNSYNSDVITSVVIKSDFAVLMEAIHKDLSYIIMENMIDSTGNIDAEYNGTDGYIRGGYSLSSEIVQINADGIDSQNNLLLKFEYK